MLQLSLPLILLASKFSVVFSYRIFVPTIPNGNIVPNPCTTGKIWPGVGHQYDQGGGAKNQFGLDFLANGQVSLIYLPSYLLTQC